ncbi:MAG: hypothetical protein ACE5EC_02260 [Phycisphaerae bacterium]
MPPCSVAHPDPPAVVEPLESGRSDGDPRSSSSRARLLRIAAPASLALLTFLVCLPALGPWCTLTPDGIDYLTNARSLRETLRFPAGALARPPGFPVLLAPLMILGDTPFSRSACCLSCPSPPQA